MRIDAIELHRVQIPLKRAFVHATSSRSTSEAVLVCAIDDEGRTGWGEIRPRAYVTGETLDGAMDRDAPELAARLCATELPDRDAVLGWAAARLCEPEAKLATIGGLEAALLDVAGQRMGFSLADAVGGAPGPELPPGVVIGFEIATAALPRHCAMLRLHGRRHVKIKVGAPDDEARVQAVAEVLGADLPLRLDANGIWTADEAIERLRPLARFCLHSIEQPVAKNDLPGMRRVREATGLAVMADESLCSAADAHRIVAERAADIFNVRIGKHGGLLAAKTIVAIGRDAGMQIHLGTLVGETGILSRHAEVLSRLVSGLTCLDGKGQHEFLLSEDVIRLPEGERVSSTPLSAPGLGLFVDRERVQRFRVKPLGRVTRTERSLR